MSDTPKPASIIVPAFREAPNIPALVQRVFAAMSEAGIEAELIIVDDNSADGTEEAVAALADKYQVRIIVRRNERGLASAVIAGLRAARYDRFVSLDADLQHPPEIIPLMLEQLDCEGCDFVMATRYAAGGGVEGSWPWHRRLNSWGATLLARPLAPLSDPMSGFFAMTHEAFERAATLDPIGYKIALELFVKARCRNPREVPIQFATRTAGESKLSFAEQMRYIRHLGRLYRFKFPWLVVAGPLGLVAVLVAIWMAL